MSMFALSPDNSMLVIAWKSLLLKQYDWSSKECVKKWKVHNGHTHHGSEALQHRLI